MRIYAEFWHKVLRNMNAYQISLIPHAINRQLLNVDVSFHWFIKQKHATAQHRRLISLIHHVTQRQLLNIDVSFHRFIMPQTDNCSTSTSYSLIHHVRNRQLLNIDVSFHWFLMSQTGNCSTKTSHFTDSSCHKQTTAQQRRLISLIPHVTNRQLLNIHVLFHWFLMSQTGNCSTSTSYFTDSSCHKQTTAQHRRLISLIPHVTNRQLLNKDVSFHWFIISRADNSST